MENEMISDLISDLVNVDKALSSIFLKTKVFANKIQNKELLDWISKEANGYDEGIPQYRIYRGAISGSYFTGSLHCKNQPIPTSGLEKIWQEEISLFKFTQSISALESMLLTSKSNVLVNPFPSEILGLIQDSFDKTNQSHIQLLSAKKSISLIAVSEILSIVRNKMLDFILKIDSEFGDTFKLSDLKNKNKEITTIMNQTIIHTSGDGNTVNTGDKSKLNINVNISKSNKDELVNYLKEVGVNEVDSNELIEIIDIDEPNIENKIFGSKVNNWMKKMLSKSVDGTWQVSIGAAGAVLGDAITKYYGM